MPAAVRGTGRPIRMGHREMARSFARDRAATPHRPCLSRRARRACAKTLSGRPGQAHPAPHRRRMEPARPSRPSRRLGHGPSVPGATSVRPCSSTPSGTPGRAVVALRSRCPCVAVALRRPRSLAPTPAACCPCPATSRGPAGHEPWSATLDASVRAICHGNFPGGRAANAGPEERGRGTIRVRPACQ